MRCPRKIISVMNSDDLGGETSSIACIIECILQYDSGKVSSFILSI